MGTSEKEDWIMTSAKRYFLLALALLVAATPAAWAQIAGGNIYGTVTDESGAVLPGVTVTISGETGTRTSVTGNQGEFRFLNLERGRYKVAVNLTGFTTVNREVQVVTGENVNVTFGLKVATVEETVTVTAETPLVDVKKRGTATTMTTEELTQVPNARDPWGVLKNVPGVLVDRVNIAGNENGQQASAGNKGAGSSDNMWNLDGLVITDMSATGASPTYFDFEAFNEISITTGGTDLNVQAGGVGINLTTKRGTNKFHGSARFFLAHDDLGFNNTPPEVENDPRLQQGLATGKGDHLQQLTDYGFDLGGPIVKDKLWFYGTYGKQDIRNVLYTQTYDKTLLPSYNAKLNWQATKDTMVSAFYFVGSKQKFGRGVGYPLNETDDFKWNQDNAYVDGGMPGGLWKGEISQTFSPNFFMSAKVAYYDTGFGLFPRGGADQTYTLDYVAGEAIGSYVQYEAIRPQKTLNLDGNYFFSGLGGNNELKFGFGYRDIKTFSTSVYQGNAIGGAINTPTDYVAFVWRDKNVEYTGKYYTAYIGDLLTKDRFSLNVGVRWDGQSAKNSPTSVGGNKTFPNALPGVDYAGDTSDVISWSTFSPRVGLSFAFDEARKTVARASYANYGEQLSFGWVNNVNPVSAGYLAYAWNDANGDRFVQADEVDLGSYLYNYNIDPGAPSALSSPNRIDSDLKPHRDQELIVGIDHELGANFAVGAAYTWRKGSDFVYRPRLAGDCAGPTASDCPIITPADHTANAPVTSNGYTGFTYSPNAAMVDAGAGGRLRTNAAGYTTSYNGVEFTLTKRLSNRWMGRLALSWNDWVGNWDGQPYGVINTAANPTTHGNPTAEERDANVQGGQVAILSGGSGKASFYTTFKWQLYANALVQLGWGVDLSGALFARQGGAYPVSVNAGAGADGTLRALATTAVDTLRYDDVYNLDLRLSKTLRFGGSGLTLSAEWFNVLNNGVILGRSRNAGSAVFVNPIQGADVANGLGRVEEILAPSIFRLGARFSF
jgi:hypothetical protein